MHAFAEPVHVHTVSRLSCHLERLQDGQRNALRSHACIQIHKHKASPAIASNTCHTLAQKVKRERQWFLQ